MDGINGFKEYQKKKKNNNKNKKVLNKIKKVAKDVDDAYLNTLSKVKIGKTDLKELELKYRNIRNKTGYLMHSVPKAALRMAKQKINKKKK